MNDGEGQSSEQPKEPEFEPSQIVTLEMFQSVNLNAPLADLKQMDYFDLAQCYGTAATEAVSGSRAVDEAVFRLIGALCSCHLRVDDRANPFGPMAALANGSRSPIPADYRGEQNVILLNVIPLLSHPSVRARVADIVWQNDKRLVVAATSAIEGYCEVVESLSADRSRLRFMVEFDVAFEEVELVTRALQIAGQINKKDPLPERLIANAIRLYRTSQSKPEPGIFARVGELILNYRILSPQEVATDAEAVGSLAIQQGNPPPHAVKRAFDLAASAYSQAKNLPKARECKLKSVDQTLAMQNQVSNASAKSSWIRTAIAELRHIQDTRQQRTDLQSQLRILQEEAQDDFGTFSVPLDLGDIPDKVIEIFGELSLPDALLQFAFVVQTPKLDEVRRNVLDRRTASPLINLFTAVHLDHQGKVIAETGGMGLSDEPNEIWVKAEISRELSFNRQYFIAGYIEPARVVLSEKYSFSEKDFLVIATNSPLIPATHAHTMAFGFAKFFQGDFISASYILVPQLEECIRHLIRSGGGDPSKIMPDMLEEDRPLSALLVEHKQKLLEIFGQNLFDEIELMFVFRPGPALRHEFAHGKIGAGRCFDPSVIYACWFMYKLTVLPLARVWRKHIAQAIEAESL